MGQVVQLVGAVLIVGAYVAASQKRIRFDSIPFLALNAVGAAILAVVAAVNRDYGFLLLETVWAWVAIRALRRAIETDREAKAKEAAKRRTAAGRSRRSTTQPTRRRRRKNPLRGV